MNYAELQDGFVMITNEDHNETKEYISTRGLRLYFRTCFFATRMSGWILQSPDALDRYDCIGQILVSLSAHSSSAFAILQHVLVFFISPEHFKMIIAFIIVDSTGGFQKVLIP